MRKHFQLLLGIVALSGIATEALAASFPDTAGTPYETAFTALQQDGIVQGYRDGRGYPGAALNRAEALKVVLEARGGHRDRIAWMRGHLPALALYRDTDQREWYAPYVEVAFEQGIVTGYGDQTFRPAQALTVEEALALLLRAYGVQGGDAEAALSPSIENRPGEWFTAYVNVAIERNLLMRSSWLRLGAPITRGQFFDIVYRLREAARTGAAAYDGPEPAAVNAASGVANPQPVRTGTTTDGAPTHPYGSEQYFAITMPTLGIDDLTVTHPEDPFSKDGLLSVLRFGVGHLFAYPGGGGKVMVYGHSSGYPWDVSAYTKVFRKINQLQLGDRVYVTYAGKLYVYEVSAKQAVDAKDQSAFADDGTGEELILYTCWPPDSISQRYLVHAQPVETVALE